MRQDRRNGRKTVNHAGRWLWLILALTIACALALPGVSHSQQNQCWTLVNGVWTYNPACSQTPNAPLKVAVGKQLTVNNTLTLSGTDNAALNIGQGGTLGSAAFASAQSFQPSGGALNLVAIDTSTTITCNMSGTKTFTVAPGLGFVSNMIVTAYVTSSPATYMVASVSSYSNTALVLSQPTYSQGTYTGTGWTIQISGPQGPQGATGTGAAPVGSMELFAGASLPASYLWCSGPSFERVA